MNFNDVKLAAKLVMRAGRVPMIQGPRGIGKSSLARAIANEENMVYINIDANLLKEGEIGGLPISADRKEKVKVKVDGEVKLKAKVVGKKTEYAPYHKLLKAIECCNEGKDVLLFIDELNRCEPAVIQEMMNLILNREINGLSMPDNCYLLGAMNPPGSNDSGDTNYQVTEMDAAAIDRFIWLDMESNIKDWMDWAASSINIEAVEDEKKVTIKAIPRKQFIHPDIVEFLVQHPDLLNVQPTETNPITPSPRSWEMLSDCLYVYNGNTKAITERIFFEISKGAVGSDVAGELIRSMKDKSNPLITADEFFKMKDIDKLKDIVKREKPTRQFLLYKNVLNFLIDQKTVKATMYNRLVDTLEVLPADMMVSVMKTIKNNYAKVHKACTSQDKYLELYMKMHNYVK